MGFPFSFVPYSTRVYPNKLRPGAAAVAGAVALHAEVAVSDRGEERVVARIDADDGHRVVEQVGFFDAPAPGARAGGDEQALVRRNKDPVAHGRVQGLGFGSRNRLRYGFAANAHTRFERSAVVTDPPIPDPRS